MIRQDHYYHNLHSMKLHQYNHRQTQRHALCCSTMMDMAQFLTRIELLTYLKEAVDSI